MDKLIITVTCDSDSAFPGNPHNPTPKGMDVVVSEYIRGIDAGAAISHIHGPRKLDDAPQPDGSRLSTLDIPGWGKMTERDRQPARYGHAVRNCGRQISRSGKS